MVRAGFRKQVFCRDRSLEAIRKALGDRRADEAFKTHYAWEGLIISKCVCMDVKRLAWSRGVAGLK